MRYLSPVETMIAATNLKRIEEQVGHPVSPAMFHMEELGKGYMSPVETMHTATNIQRIEKELNRDYGERSSYSASDIHLSGPDRHFYPKEKNVGILNIINIVLEVINTLIC